MNDLKFDWVTYIENYKDLVEAGINTEKEAYRHWINYGKKEGRIYSKIDIYKNSNDFDWKFYVDNYEDLQKNGINTRKKAYEHWIQYGQFEGRIMCKKTEIIHDNTLDIIYYVGETCESKFNTGIQRVVRLLGKHLNNKCNLRLVKFDFDKQCFINLSDDEKNHMQNFSGIHIKNNVSDFVLQDKWLVMPEVIIKSMNKSIQPIFNEAKRNKMKIASIFYDDIPYKLKYFYPEYVSNFFKIFLDTLLTSDLILPISYYSYDRLLTYCNTSNKDGICNRIIPCSLPGEFINVPRNLTYYSSTISTNKYSILCISTIERRKNQIPLIRAIELLKNKYSNIELILVGIINDNSYYNDILKYINSNNNIKHYPIINDNELKNLYMDCCLTVYPSIEEGFGLPILESLWNCKPCICMNYGSMAEVATAGCLKIDCNNVDNIAKTIDEFISDSNIREKLVDEIKNIKFKSWEIYTDEIISQIKAFDNSNFDIVDYLYNNIYSKIIDKNLLNKYITIHNKKPLLNTIINSKSNTINLKIGIDTTPTYHKDYMNRGVGFLVKNYIDVLSKISDINLVPLSENSCNDSFDVIHFTCPPATNDSDNNDIQKKIKFIREQCIKTRCSKVYIITIYDLIPHIFTDIYKPSKIYYEFMDLLQQMDLIITISNSTKNDLIKIFNLTEDKIYIIYPPLRNNFFQINNDDKNIQASITLKKYRIVKKFILYTGGIDFRKNIINTIQGYAFAKNSYNIDTQLVIVAAIDKKTQNYYSNFINELKLQQDDIIFTNYVSDLELNILCNSAYVNIYISLYEGFGMPIIESINCNIPIIISNTSSMIELFDLSSNNLLTVDPYNIESIANMIKYVFNIDRNTCSLLSNNSRNILPLFSDDMIKIELANAYKYALIKYNT